MASNDKPNKLPPIRHMTTSKTAKITEEMRDRQSRNKDPNTGLASSSSHDSDSRSSKKATRVVSSYDAYESAERRGWASSILDSPELLMMHALSRGDSVAGTRQHFTKILCGYDDPPKHTDWKAARKEKEKEKLPVSQKIYRPYTGTYEM